ncbi:MAG: hypothetical protein QOE01_3307 [Actinomycetota bacterium]|nr:hypothetical protein [Actinomycetota bacterium]
MSLAANLPEAAARADPRGRRTGAPSADDLHRVIAAQRALAGAELDPQVIFRLLAELAADLLGAEGAVSSQPEGDVLVARATVGAVPVPPGDVIPRAGTLGGLALDTMTPQLCRDGRTDPRTTHAINLPNGTLSSVVVPLVYDGQAIGLVGALSSQPNAFDETDLELLSMLAHIGANRLGHALTRRAGDVLRSRAAALIDAMSDGLIVQDEAGRNIFVNDSAARILGVPVDALTADVSRGNDFDAVREDGSDWPRESRPTAAALATAAPQRDQLMGVRGTDGQLRWLLVNAIPTMDRAGEVSGVVCSFSDVTDRENAARALAASEQHFRVAFDNAPIGMSMISLKAGEEGQYLRANDAFCAMLGYLPIEVAALTLTDLTHPDDVDRDSAMFGDLIAGRTRSVAFEKRYLHRDGHAVFAWLTSAVAQDGDGQPLYLITHAVDVTERRREQAELERLALTDTLTGLANRALLNSRLDQALARLQRSDSACALLLLDIDRFKLVNDSLGHQIGDALLIEVAARLETVTRADSTVARLGGDEFVVLVDDLGDVEALHTIASRLIAELRRPYELEGAETVSPTVSIGISVATTPDRTASDLYREADLALYRAKDAGRDQYALFDDDLRARAVARLEAESLLRRALAEDRLVPVFQPLLDLDSGTITAVEALVRIEDPVRGLVLPVEFIDAAEETGLIVEVDARMFELAIRTFAKWTKDELPALRRVSTNVSPRSLSDPTFVDRLDKTLRWYGVPGSCVLVELTERSLLTTSPAIRESLERIAALGIRVGLDDFGTGYSALAYLQRFELHFLKIDRSFVSRLGQSLRDDALVGAVIDLAHAHELVVVAEGVETVHQLAALRGLGCDRVQGYLIGRPVRAEEITSLVLSSPRW